MKKRKNNMKDFYEFASESPFLCFFLILIIGQTLVGVATTIAGIFK
jgi:hypothetical protein